MSYYDAVFQSHNSVLLSDILDIFGKVINSYMERELFQNVMHALETMRSYIPAFLAIHLVFKKYPRNLLDFWKEEEGYWKLQTSPVDILSFL